MFRWMFQDYCRYSTNRYKRSHHISGEIKMFAAHNTYLQSSEVINNRNLKPSPLGSMYSTFISSLMWPYSAQYIYIYRYMIHVPIMQQFGSISDKVTNLFGFLGSPAVGPNEVSLPVEESSLKDFSHQMTRWIELTSWFSLYQLLLIDSPCVYFLRWRGLTLAQIIL